jgi:hypothetical protein
LDPNTVLFADDMNILISGENLNIVQFKLNKVMQDIETWFASNSLIVNAGKTMAISFHTSQNKNQPYHKCYLKTDRFHVALKQNF